MYDLKNFEQVIYKSEESQSDFIAEFIEEETDVHIYIEHVSWTTADMLIKYRVGKNSFEIRYVFSAWEEYYKRRKDEQIKIIQVPRNDIPQCKR